MDAVNVRQSPTIAKTSLPGAVNAACGLAVPDSAINLIAKHPQFVEYVIPEEAFTKIYDLVPGKSVYVQIQVIMKGINSDENNIITIPATYQLDMSESITTNGQGISHFEKASGPMILKNKPADARIDSRLDYKTAV